MFSLVKNTSWTVVENAAAAGTTDLTTDTSDMQGFDSILYIVKLGDVTSGSVITLTAYSNPTDSASGGTSEKAGTQITAGASDYDNKLLLLEVHRPSQRYMYAVLVIDTQNAVVDSIIAVRFNAKSVPITQGSTVGQTTFGGPNA
jgi:hypothetical protein